MDSSGANRILNLTRELRWQIGEDFHENLAEGIYADASEIAGGGADSWDFDALFLGWRYGDVESGLFEVAGGRLDYTLAKGFLVDDGYSDGGSRGGYWSNPRTAWAPGFSARFLSSQHTAELFYLERDERPEHDSETRLGGLNYQWTAPGTDLEGRHSVAVEEGDRPGGGAQRLVDESATDEDSPVAGGSRSGRLGRFPRRFGRPGRPPQPDHAGKAS